MKGNGDIGIFKEIISIQRKQFTHKSSLFFSKSSTLFLISSFWSHSNCIELTRKRDLNLATKSGFINLAVFSKQLQHFFGKNFCFCLSDFLPRKILSKISGTNCYTSRSPSQFFLSKKINLVFRSCCKKIVWLLGRELDRGRIGNYIRTIHVAYFDQQMGALHAVVGSKSSFWHI